MQLVGPWSGDGSMLSVWAAAHHGFLSRSSSVDYRAATEATERRYEKKWTWDARDQRVLEPCVQHKRNSSSFSMTCTKSLFSESPTFDVASCATIGTHRRNDKIMAEFSGWHKNRILCSNARKTGVLQGLWQTRTIRLAPIWSGCRSRSLGRNRWPPDSQTNYQESRQVQESLSFF